MLPRVDAGFIQEAGMSEFEVTTESEDDCPETWVSVEDLWMPDFRYLRELGVVAVWRCPETGAPILAVKGRGIQTFDQLLKPAGPALAVVPK